VRCNSIGYEFDFESLRVSIKFNGHQCFNFKPPITVLKESKHSNQKVFFSFFVAKEWSFVNLNRCLLILATTSIRCKKPFVIVSNGS
jgi:hypothetical protein